MSFGHLFVGVTNILPPTPRTTRTPLLAWWRTITTFHIRHLAWFCDSQDLWFCNSHNMWLWRSMWYGIVNVW